MVKDDYVFKVIDKEDKSIHTVFSVTIDKKGNTYFLLTVGEWYWDDADNYELYIEEGMNVDHI